MLYKLKYFSCTTAFFLIFSFFFKTRRIGNLLNNTEVFLLPSLNPDGFARSREGQCDNNRQVGFLSFATVCCLFLFYYVSIQLKFFFYKFCSQGRNNGNNVDLNRNFPKQFDESTSRLRVKCYFVKLALNK